MASTTDSITNSISLNLAPGNVTVLQSVSLHKNQEFLRGSLRSYKVQDGYVIIRICFRSHRPAQASRLAASCDVTQTLGRCSAVSQIYQHHSMPIPHCKDDVIDTVLTAINRNVISDYVSIVTRAQ